MALTSRRKRPLDRTIPYQRDTRLIIIAAEGEKTEKQYFESKLFGNVRVQVKVLPTEEGYSAPKHVLDRLKTFAEETQLQPDDQLWLVLDKDRWPDEQLAYVCGHAVRGRKKKADLAVSNPCFELWLYLHQEGWPPSQQVSSQDMKQALRRLLGQYSESHLNTDQFKGCVYIAVERAENLDGNPGHRWPQNPGTQVYKLVRAIRDLETGA